MVTLPSIGTCTPDPGSNSGRKECHRQTTIVEHEHFMCTMPEAAAGLVYTQPVVAATDAVPWLACAVAVTFALHSSGTT